MKTKLISSKPAASNEIDWSKVGLYRTSDPDVLVLSNVKHNGDCFSGTLLIDIQPDGERTTSPS